MAWKRQLYLWHRWLGIALCLVMALWFVSGLVMLYVGYPKLTPAERLSHLPALPADCCSALPPDLAGQPVQGLRLTSLGGRAVYRLEQADGQRLWLDAATGQALPRADRSQVLASAGQFAPHARLLYGGQVQEDTWTHSRSLDADRPLHWVAVDDVERTRLYLSGRSGEVVLDATARERHWNWLGAWLHWLYPLRDGFGHADGWRLMVIGLSLLGTVMALLGMVIGVMRWRLRRPYRSGSRSPYPPGWLRWHHVGGLLFGVILVAWVFSGLMSMRPWALTDSRSQLDRAALRGGALIPAEITVDIPRALRQLRDEQAFATVELSWQRLAGESYLVAWNATGDSRILQDDGSPALRQLAPDRLLSAATAMAPGTSLQHEWLEHYDSYYLQRAEQSMYGSQRRPLPVMRVRFDDLAQSWIYLDPRSGELVAEHDRRQRIGRWLFNLLHSWDLQPFLQRPLLREVLIIAFSLGGLIICLSGIVLGWRRLSRSKPRRRATVSARGDNRAR